MKWASRLRSTWKAPAPLSQYGKLGSAKQWSHTLLFKYFFNAPEAKLRPFVGVSVTHVWFSDAKITNGAFESGVLHGPTSVDTDSSWAPVFNVGAVYNFTQHWFAGFSVPFIPLKATATLRIRRRKHRRVR